MLELKKIVYCSDFSGQNEKAFEMASGMAASTQAKLYALHVVPKSVDERGRDNPHWIEAATKSAASKIEEACVAPFDVGVESAVRYGNEAREIIAFSEEVGADLIVMGAKGLGFVEGFFGGGSVTDKVVKNSKIPVLVVPQT